MVFLDPRIEQLARKQVYFGTSSWKYPGWAGWFYTKPYRTQKDFNENCLSEYAQHYPGVGVDHTYYTWPVEKLFQKYAEQTPENFRFGLKVTERVTVFRFPTLPRYGKDAGKVNESFLNPEVFKEQFLEPLRSISPRIGPLMLEFSQFYPGMLESGRDFTERLDAFFAALANEKQFQFAVEMRNRNWLKPAYFEMLARHGVSHVFNSWTRMPALHEQWDIAKTHPQRMIVSRILLQPGTKYEDAVEAFSPYDKVVEEHPPLRLAAAELVERAVELKLPAYMFVNNRAEGCAPKTIEAILNLLQQRGLFNN